jgi:molecular chaperone GrpE
MPPKKKKSKVKELEVSLKEAESKADNYLNQLKYVKADLENLKKQNQRQVSQIVDRAIGHILMQLLPIVDELGLVLNNNLENPKTHQGIEMIYKKLIKLLESEGCQPIESVGKPFDPFKHEAVFEVETEKQPEGYVLEEIRKGYTYKDRVLRASMVKVARTPFKEEDENE